MLRSARLVTLVGPGGVGKTRLAQRLARQVERVFPDGVVLVELAALQDAASLSTTIAGALGIDPQDFAPDVAITAYLRTRRLLLVLDNCEHVLDACHDLVAGLLSDAPDLRVLATSRQPLGLPEEHVMVIGTLAVPTAEEAAAGRVGHADAVALLADRARAVAPGFRVDAGNAALVARLCRALDGIPLAIELAAPRLRVLALAQLVDRLDEPLALLTTGPRDAPGRHQTLRAVIDWSYELCTPQEQALWARMSVFEGGADHDAVEAVGGEPGSSVADALAGLVDKSIVISTAVDDRPRYRMLETIREYGAERFAERGEEDGARRRHQEHFVRFARSARTSAVGADQLGWLARVSLDLGNVRTAFEHSLARDDAASALEMATSLVWFWSPGGAPDEGAKWFTRALACADDESPPLLHALAAAAILAGDRSDVDTALAVAQRAATLPVRGDDAADSAARWILEATGAIAGGDLSTAEAAYREALAAYQEAGDLFGQLECWAMVGVTTGYLGRTDEAVATLAQGRLVCEAHGEVIMRGQLLDYTAVLLTRAGRSREALGAIKQCLSNWSIRRPFVLVSALLQAAQIFADEGEEATAAGLLGARERIWDDHGLLPGPFSADEARAAVRKKAVDVLGEESFQEAFDAGYAMTRAQAVGLVLGRELSDPHPPSSDATAVLSKRERQVAQLLATGSTNKQIAAELTISSRTAEGHVAKVMDKLGVTSREQVAAWLVGAQE
jgi:non-specific serine/threonine protein kinase